MGPKFYSDDMPHNEGVFGSRGPFQQHYDSPAPKESGSEDGEQNINNPPQSSRRGRPIGSKNKQKEKPEHYKESHEAMMPHVVQVQSGADIVRSLGGFYQKLQVGGIYVLSALGNVVDVTISIAGSVRFFPGLWQIISLSGLYLPHCSSLSLSVVDSKGRVISGMVDGILRAAGPVDIVVGSCVDPSLHRVRPISVGGEEGSGNTPYPSGSFTEPNGQIPPLPEPTGQIPPLM